MRKRLTELLSFNYSGAVWVPSRFNLQGAEELPRRNIHAEFVEGAAFFGTLAAIMLNCLVVIAKAAIRVVDF